MKADFLVLACNGYLDGLAPTVQSRVMPLNNYIIATEPLPEDEWRGYTGFIHQVLHDEYLSEHPAPEDCEYYLCGPPVMNAAVIKMLDNLGEQPENIMLDDFGG